MMSLGNNYASPARERSKARHIVASYSEPVSDNHYKMLDGEVDASLTSQPKFRTIFNRTNTHSYATTRAASVRTEVATIIMNLSSSLGFDIKA